MSTIVATTDLSDAAKRALPLAWQLADALGLPLVLLHVVHAPVLAPPLTSTVDLDRAEAQRELEQLARGLGEGVRVLVREAEDVATGIVQEAESAGAELLVMASHGRTGLGRLLLGSVAEKVLETARTPVVCVPARGDTPTGIGHLVVTSDLTDAAIKAFPVARRLAGALSLPMTLLVVDDPNAPRDMSQLSEHAALLGESDTSNITTEVVPAPDVAQGIEAKARQEEATLVCTAASPKSPLRKLLLGSVSRDVMRSGSFPVVIVPAQ